MASAAAWPAVVGVAMGVAKPFMRSLAWKTSTRTALSYGGGALARFVGEYVSLWLIATIMAAWIVMNNWASKSKGMIMTACIAAFVLVRLFGRWILALLLLEVAGGGNFVVARSLAALQLVRLVVCESAALLQSSSLIVQKNKSSSSSSNGSGVVSAILTYLAGGSAWSVRHASARNGRAVSYIRLALLLLINTASLCLLNYMLFFRQPVFVHHIGGVFYEGSAVSTLSFWADINAWTLASKITPLLPGAGAWGWTWDLKLMAMLPPVVFMSRSELFVYKVLRFDARVMLLVGDAFLHTFGLLNQFRGATQNGVSGVVVAALPLAGSLLYKMGLVAQGGIDVLPGFHLRLIYNILTLLFHVVAVMPVDDGAASVNMHVRYFRQKKFTIWVGCVALGIVLSVELARVLL